MLNLLNRIVGRLIPSEMEVPKDETALLTLGKLLSKQHKDSSKKQSIHDAEFKVFSQWGDDGIIQWLIQKLEIEHRIFIEFGVSDYSESNTRFLMMNDNWSGFVMDGSETNIQKIVESEYYWRYELQAKAVFIHKENINHLISAYTTIPDIGLLHIDLDGNDYWIWNEINVVKPVILILEYNSVFGSERCLSVPYDKDFDRTKAHYSNLYFGASLPALVDLSNQKGYAFIGCNSAGNNAYFIRRDKMKDSFEEVSVEEGFVMSKARESRDQAGNLTFVSGSHRIDLIRGLPVINTKTNKKEII